MNSRSSRRAGDRRLRAGETAIGSVVLSIDLLLALILGPAAGAVVVLSDTAAKAAPAVLGASSGICAGILALALAAAGFVGFLADSAYLRLIDKVPGGVRGMRAPFLVVAVVAAVGTLVSLAAMLLWSTLGGAPWFYRAAVFGLACCLLVWSLVGAVQLVSQGMYHAARRAQLAGLVEEVERRRPPRQLPPDISGPTGMARSPKEPRPASSGL
jgi:hypothetical protein